MLGFLPTAMMKSALPALTTLSAFSAFVPVRVSGSRFDRLLIKPCTFVRQEKPPQFAMSVLNPHLQASCSDAVWFWRESGGGRE
jgi:hypothetical protein